MHVLHIIEATIGGARRHVVDACRGLRARGLRVTLVASALREPAVKRDFAELAGLGVEVRELPMVRPVRPGTDAGHLFALRRILAELRPDVVHTHSSKGGALGRAASISTGIGARVHTPHTFAFLFSAMFGGASRGLYRTVERALAGRTQRFIAVSDDEAVTFARTGFVQADRVRVVPNGIDPRPWSDAVAADLGEFGVPDGAPATAVMGLYNVAKGQDLAIRALAQPGLERLHLLLAGVGEEQPAYGALAAELGVAERVHVLGWRDDLPRIVKALDLVLLPSRWEGMPYIVLEAMASGRPVVATRVDGARGVVEAAGCGELCDVGSVESIARGVRAVLEAPAERRLELGRRGQGAVAERYNVERMVDGLAAVYRELA